MASRQEEKERRRQERLEREAAEARSAGRRKRLQLVFGGLLALLLLAGVAYGATTVIGEDDDGPKAVDTSDEARANLPKLPEQQTTDVEEAAKAAGCKIEHPEYEGADHVEGKEFTAADYKTNPPTSGAHNPNWYEDGIYEPGTVPKLGELVHTLEHGRINVQYRKGSGKQITDQLEAFVVENDGYHMMMYENTTDMPYAVAATAWTHSLGCPDMNPKVFDAMRTFRDKYIDKGPEQIP